MFTNTREIERKFTITEGTYNTAFEFLSTVSVPKITATSFDLYWATSKADFIRLRDNSAELTVKVTDKGSIVDRIEENVVVERASLPACKRLLTLLYGEPTLKLTKKFSVFQYTFTPAPGTHFQAILCLYKVTEDGQDRVFFEVEAESLAIVDAALTSLGNALPLKSENRSLFQIFDSAFDEPSKLLVTKIDKEEKIITVDKECDVDTGPCRCGAWHVKDEGR